MKPNKRFSKKPGSSNLFRARLAIDKLVEKEQDPNDGRDFGALQRPYQSRKKMRKDQRKSKKTGHISKEEVTTTTDDATPVMDVPKKEETKVLDTSQSFNENRRAKKKVKLSKKGKKAKRNKDLLAANKEEDRTIKKLERDLNFRKKRKTKELIIPGIFKADGLDYLLDIVDPKKLEAWKEEAKDSDDDDEFLGDLGLGDEAQSDDEDEDDDNDKHVEDGDNDDDDLVEDGFDEGNDENDNGGDNANDDLDGDSEDDDDDDGGDDDDIDDDDKAVEPDNASDSEDSDIAVSSKKTKENKGTGSKGDKKNKTASSDSRRKVKDKGSKRKRTDSESSENDGSGEVENKEGSDVVNDGPLSSSTYIPPHKRAQMMGDSISQEKKEELLKTKRQLKGLINRMSESNMKFIVGQVEDMYNTKSRNDMNETLFSVIQESLIIPTLTSDRLVMEHVLLIAILHSNIGNEVGAHFVQNFTTAFDTEHKKIHDIAEPDKKCDNLISVITHMYNFKVIHCCLIYDIINVLVDSFKEQDIEMLLLLLKNAGMQLRKDDPSSLKDIILQIQAKAASSSHEFQTQSRIKFMLDTIYALRNNNVRKIPNYDPDHLERLRKVLRSMIGSRGHNDSDSTLRVSMKDLLSVDQRGRWWIVGSAWSGRGPSDKPSDEDGISKDFPGLGVKDSKYEKIMDLARKQRMNTDIRKNLFGVIVTAEDYEDGFQKVLKLGLKGGQEKEIIHVILDCCQQESMYNPYYSHLASKLCLFDRKLRMACQFSYWDKFNMMDELTKVQTRNLALMLSNLLSNKALSLSVLKVIEFADISKNMVKFLKILMTSLLDQDAEKVRAVFNSIANISKLNHLRETLSLFLHHFMLKKLKPDEGTELKMKVNIAEEAMNGGKNR